MKKSVMKAAAYTIIVVPSVVISSTTYALYGLKATVEVLLGLFIAVLLTVICGVLDPIERWVASTQVFKKIVQIQQMVLRRIK